MIFVSSHEAANLDLSYWTEPNPRYVALERRLKSAERRGQKRMIDAIKFQMSSTPKTRSWTRKAQYGGYWFPRGARVWLALRGVAASAICCAPRKCHPPSITLRQYQRDVVDRAVDAGDCVICAPTGSGKTAIALGIMQAAPARTIIAVPTERLIEQWYAAVDAIPALCPVEVSRGNDWTMQTGAQTVITTHRSLGLIQDVTDMDDCRLIVDEAHHAGGAGLTQAIFDSRYYVSSIIGLTATPQRQHESGRYLEALFGPTITVTREQALAANAITSADVIKLRLPEYAHADPVERYSRAIKDLVGCAPRNETIASTTNMERVQGGVVLVLTERVEHAVKLHKIVGDRLVTGEHDEGAIPDDGGIMVATIGVCGEGFDLPSISSVILATPMAWEGRVHQVVGRALRPAPGKERARIVDLVDAHPVFQAQWARRARTYRKLGFRIF